MLVILARNITVSIISSFKRAQLVEELREELSSKKQEQAYLSQKLVVAKGQEFVEDQARTKLGLIKPGETIVIDEKIEAKKPTVIGLTVPVWFKWWKLFFGS